MRRLEKKKEDTFKNNLTKWKNEKDKEKYTRVEKLSNRKSRQDFNFFYEIMNSEE